MERSPPARAARAPTLPQSKWEHDRFHSHDKDVCISFIERVTDHVENDYSGRDCHAVPIAIGFVPKRNGDRRR
jgi:hypothetical protein